MLGNHLLKIELSKGQKILIHGGAGGIGSVAIQLANLGAYIATAVSANDKQFVQELGADVVIDYKTQDFENMLHNYDVVIYGDPSPELMQTEAKMGEVGVKTYSFLQGLD